MFLRVSNIFRCAMFETTKISYSNFSHFLHFHLLLLSLLYRFLDAKTNFQKMQLEMIGNFLGTFQLIFSCIRHIFFRGFKEGTTYWNCCVAAKAMDNNLANSSDASNGQQASVDIKVVHGCFSWCATGRG